MLTKARKGQTGAMITLERALRTKANKDEGPSTRSWIASCGTEASRRSGPEGLGRYS